MRISTLSALLLAAFLAPGPVLATHGYPAGDCRGDVINIADTIWWIIVGDTPDRAFGYLEANGEPGLQRGYFNDAPGLLNMRDICFETDNPDMMWY